MIFDTTAGRLIGTVEEQTSHGFRLRETFLLQFTLFGDSLKSQLRPILYAPGDYWVVHSGLCGHVQAESMFLAAYDSARLDVEAEKAKAAAEAEVEKAVPVVSAVAAPVKPEEEVAAVAAEVVAVTPEVKGVSDGVEAT